MAFTSIAALIAGEAATAGLVLGAVAEVGMAMTVVGAVTGDKTLMKVGGAMSLVGGIGGMVSSMGSAVDAAASVGGAEAGAAPDLVAGADASMGGPAATADMASGASGSLDASAVNGLADNIDAGGGFNPATAGGDGIVGSAMQPGADASSMTQVAADGTTPMPVDGSSPASAPGTTPNAKPIDPVQTPAGTVSPPAAAPAYNAAKDSQAANSAMGDSGFAGYRTAPTPTQSYWDSMTRWIQDPKNKTVLELGAKLGGGALQGMQQQSMFNEKMGLERDRLKQTSYGSQVGQNRPHGIINGART